MDLTATVVTLGLGFVAAIAGVFGQNLYSSLGSDTAVRFDAHHDPIALPSRPWLQFDGVAILCLTA